MSHPGLPAVLPEDFFSALTLLDQKERLDVDSLKLMILVESAGEPLYSALAMLAPCEETAALLKINGREETAHAHRLKKAIEVLTEEPFEIPPLSDNPYAEPPTFSELTPELLRSFQEGEAAGDESYQRHADAEDDPRVAELLRQNGREEIHHGERVGRVIEILNSATN